jgi:hypothetical protein
VRLEAGEAAELAGLLSFLGDWLVSGGEVLAASLGRLVGGRGYDMAALGSDLARFAFLLTGEDGQRLFGGEPGGQTFRSRRVRR